MWYWQLRHREETLYGFMCRIKASRNNILMQTIRKHQCYIATNINAGEISMIFRGSVNMWYGVLIFCSLLFSTVWNCVLFSCGPMPEIKHLLLSIHSPPPLPGFCLTSHPPSHILPREGGPLFAHRHREGIDSALQVVKLGCQGSTRDQTSIKFIIVIKSGLFHIQGIYTD